MSEPQQFTDPQPEDGWAVDARRRFLRGQDLLQWWRDWGRSALRPPDSALRANAPAVVSAADDWQPSGFYSQLAKQAMACQWEVLLNYGQYPRGVETALAALESLEAWESQLSVFRPDSEISQINRRAFAGPVPVSAALWDILTAAQNLWTLTDGAFDITSGRLSDCWGFLKREGRMPNEREVALAMESVGMDKLHLDSADRSVRFLHPDVTLNLGGIGKGWTLDRVAEDLVEQGIGHFAFHGGLSSVVARGTDGRVPEARAAGGDPDRRPAGWGVRVTHPIYPDRGLGMLDLRNQALGTSGSARQFIHYRGKRLSHILDPRSGRPAEGVWSASVVAPLAAQADALGTACFVLGEEGCRRLIDVCPDLGILLVVPDGHRHRILVMGNMEACWSPAET
jgi:FAD:protein FMN transferase